MSVEKLTPLNRNEFFHEHHPHVQMLMSCEPQDFSLYPESDDVAQLESKISSLYSAHSKNIILCNGAEDALWRLLAYHRREYSSVIFSTNSWNYYKQTAESLKYEIQWISSTYQNGEFTTNLDDLRTLLTTVNKPTVVLLASPNNPTAHKLNLSELHQISLSHPDCVFIIDGTYSGLENNIMTRAAQECLNIFYINSFSKFFGLPGARIGFIVHNGELLTIRNYLGVSSMAIKLANAVLENAHYYQAVWQAGQELVHKLQVTNFKKIKVLPPTTNFALIHTGLPWSEQAAESVQLIARKQSIIIKNEQIDDTLFIRISLGTMRDIPLKIIRFLAEVDEAYDALWTSN